MSLRQCRAIGTLRGSSFHCEPSILAAADTEEGWEGEEKHGVTRNRWIPYSTIPHCSLNLFVCFALTPSQFPAGFPGKYYVYK